MSRFADIRPLQARLLLGLLLLLCCYGLFASAHPQRQAFDPAANPITTDLALYQAVAARVAEGDGYYPAVVAEQRERGYPLRPAVTVRLPTLAWLIAALGADWALHLLRLLALVAIAALTLRMRAVLPSKPLWAAATMLAAAGMTLLTVPAMVFWHESWSALLLVLSLACRSRRRWGASLIIGLSATLFRELALPYLAVMALLAWREGSRREALAWGAAAFLFLLALAAHAASLSGYLIDSDPASPGWARAGGWPLVLSFVHLSTLFAFLPLPLVAIFLPLALLGWAGIANGTFDRGAILMLGYALAFMLVGRPDNFYWGIMVAPLLPLGLAFAPRALRDLWSSARIARHGSLTSPA